MSLISSVILGNWVKLSIRNLFGGIVMFCWYLWWYCCCLFMVWGNGVGILMRLLGFLLD